MWTCEDEGRWEATPGFLLLAAVLFWLDEGVGLLVWAVLACLTHELGHVAAAAVFGGKVQKLRLSAAGAEFTMQYRHPLSYGKECLVLLAGPGANLLLGALGAAGERYLLAAANLAVGAFNLLPVLPLDGGRILYDLLADLLDPDWADRILTASAGCLIGLLVGAGAVLALYYANFTLLVTALWLLFRSIQENRAAGGGSGSGSGSGSGDETDGSGSPGNYRHGKSRRFVDLLKKRLGKGARNFK